MISNTFRVQYEGLHYDAQIVCESLHLYNVSTGDFIKNVSLPCNVLIIGGEIK